MQYQRVSFIKIIIGLLLVLSLCSGCGGSPAGKNTAPPALPPEWQEQSAGQEQLTAKDVAVFLSGNEAQKTVRLMTASNGKSYELYYDAKTDFSDRFGKATVLPYFEPGMVAEVLLSVHSKTLVSLHESPDAFILRDVTGFSIHMNRGIFSIGKDNYRITDNTAIFKNGSRVGADAIKDGDSLTLRGMQPDLYSIVIDFGDGHVRVLGTEYFIGGWVQVGKDLIKPVTEDMLLTVPEGEYDLVVTYHGRGGTKHINVQRGKETKVDVSDLKGELVKYGKIAFTILPADAKSVVKIDGEVIDHHELVELEYGVYRLEVEAEGYEPVRERIGIGQEMASIEITLQEKKDKKDTASANSSKGSSTTTTSSTGTGGTGAPGEEAFQNLQDYFSQTSSTPPAGTSDSSSSHAPAEEEGEVIPSDSGLLYIDAPSGAEVYYDGSYKGIVPCSFKKTVGTHVITLRKDGYRTKTYTLTLDNTSENETYSFSDLISE